VKSVMSDKKQIPREFLERLYEGDADGALARAVESPEMFNFTTKVDNGFRMLAAAMPAIYKEPPTRDYTAQYVDGDTVITQVTVSGALKHGGDYRNHYLVIIKLTDDKVASMQVYTDSAYANAKLAPLTRRPSPPAGEGGGEAVG
jgi:ketosteroid isomerase-like protein